MSIYSEIVPYDRESFARKVSAVVGLVTDEDIDAFKEYLDQKFEATGVKTIQGRVMYRPGERSFSES